MAAKQGIEIQTKVTGLSQAEKLARALDMVAKHSQKVGKQRTAQYFNQNEKAISRVNREMQRNLVLQQQSGKSTRRMELGFQQAGYQFQDLVVQLQGGVNPFVAISQQGSQLASFFAGPWGASIGLGIAALGALGTTMMTTMGLGKDLKEELSDLNDINDALEDFGESFGKTFIGNIEAVRETFGNLVADIYEQEIREMQRAVGKEFKGFLGAGFAASAAGSDGIQGTVQSTNLFGMPTAEALDAAKELDRRTLEVQKILNKLSSDDIVSKGALAEAFKGAYDELRQLGYVSDEYLDKLRDIATEQGLALESIKKQGKAQEDTNDLVEEEEKLTNKVNQLKFNSQIKQRQANVQNFKHQGLMNHAMIEEMGIAAAILKNKAQQAAEGKELTNAQERALNTAIAGAQAAIRVKYGIEEAKDEATKLANELQKAEQAMDRMSNFGLNLQTQLAKAKAEATALATGVDVGAAKTVAGLRSQAQQRYDEAFFNAPDFAGQQEASQLYGQQMSAIAELEKVLNANAEERERQRGASKSGSNQQKFNDYIASQERELELKIRNFGLTEEIIKRNEYEFKIKEKAASLGVKATDKQMQAVMELYDKTAQLEQLQPYLDAFEDGLTNAFASIVDGTQDVEGAFKGMLRTIILEIYKQEVAASAAKSVSGFIKGLFQADGGVHSRGLVTPFANGGVVGTPTMFPMANGVGLMGEAGPEAIMPLKRGRDGKLGVQGGGDIVVNQTINVSTGVQQTVRAEVKQMMPMLADQAKRAVLDGKRRGGGYGRGFA